MDHTIAADRGTAMTADTTPPDPFLSLDEAGAIVRKTGRWVEHHLHHHRTAGAPALIVLPSSGASGRAAAKLVDRDAWLAWVR